MRASHHAKDLNQDEIVEGLRKAGASVAITSGVGNGFSDIVVGFDRNNFLMEIKRPSSSRNRNSFSLTPKETAFAQGWRGNYHVITCLEEALAVIGITRTLVHPVNLAMPRPPLEKKA